MKIFLYLLSFSVFLLIAGMSGCKKDAIPTKPLDTSGKLVDAFNKEPIGGATVYIYTYDYSQHIPVVHIYGDTLTDADGVFQFPERKPGSYLRFFKDGYHDSYETNYELKLDNYPFSNIGTIELHPKMYVNVRVIKTDKFWNRILIFAMNTKTGGSYSIDFNSSAELDSTCKGLLIYEDYYTLRYRLAKIGHDTFEVRSVPITLKSLDTVDVTIQF